MVQISDNKNNWRINFVIIHTILDEVRKGAVVLGCSSVHISAITYFYRIKENNIILFGGFNTLLQI